MLLITGVLSELSSSISNIGDWILLVAALLFHIYEIIPIPPKKYFNFSIISFFIFASFIILIKIIKYTIIMPPPENYEYWINTIVQIIIYIIGVLVVYALLREQLYTNIKTLFDKEVYIRMGLNSAAVIHLFKNKSQTDLKYVQYINEDFLKNDERQFEKDIKSLQNLLNYKNETCLHLLKGVSRKNIYDNRKYEEIDIHEIIESILVSFFFDRSVFEKIEIEKIYNDIPLKVLGLNEEILLIFQNIIENSIKQMLSVNKERHVLKINTTKALNEGYISIFDTLGRLPRR